MNIFTFILIIPIIIFFINNIINKKNIYIIALAGTLCFSLIFLQKDLLTHQEQIEVKELVNIYKLKSFNNIGNEEYYMYESNYAFLNYNFNKCEIIINKPISNNVEKANQGFRVVWDNPSENYGVVDQNGNWIVKPSFNKVPELFENLMLFKNYAANDTPLDWNMEPADYDSEKIKEGRDLQEQIDNEKPTLSSVNYESYEKILKDLFPAASKILELKQVNFNLPFEYNLLRVNYENEYYYLFLEKDLSNKNNILYKNLPRFDKNNMTFAYTLCKKVILNSNGDIVWIEE